MASPSFLTGARLSTEGLCSPQPSGRGRVRRRRGLSSFLMLLPNHFSLFPPTRVELLVSPHLSTLTSGQSSCGDFNSQLVFPLLRSAQCRCDTYPTNPDNILCPLLPQTFSTLFQPPLTSQLVFLNQNIANRQYYISFRHIRYSHFYTQ